MDPQTFHIPLASWKTGNSHGQGYPVAGCLEVRTWGLYLLYMLQKFREKATHLMTFACVDLQLKAPGKFALSAREASSAFLSNSLAWAPRGVLQTSKQSLICAGVGHDMLGHDDCFSCACALESPLIATT